MALFEYLGTDKNTFITLMINPRYDCITYMDNDKTSEEDLIIAEEFRIKSF